MSLNKEEYIILKHVFHDPTIPYSKLAKKVNLSSPTVKKRMEQLKKKGLIQGFHAEYYPEALGLESHIFLLSVESKDKLQVLERVLQLQPYLVQLSRCYGAINGILFKVHIPIGSVEYIQSFLEYLKKHDIIKEIVHSYYIGKGIKTRLDLDYWNPVTKNFDRFDWSLWEKNVDSVDYVPAFFSLQRIIRRKAVNVLSRMQYSDFLILRELLEDTSKKNTIIAKELDIPEYTLSRRLKFLHENVIRNYLVKFDPSFFGLQDDLIFKVICGSRALTKIVYLLQNLPLPFDSDFRQTDDGFLWKILLPPRDKMKVINLLWSLFPALQIMVVDPNSYISKAFDPQNFSFRTLSWKSSYDYIVNQVLDRAKEELLIA
ncbi:MAG: winged helix-turn-helix transcriptional regulator [Candidatus Heimdallarchaeaceae archaeon]